MKQPNYCTETWLMNVVSTMGKLDSWWQGGKVHETENLTRENPVCSCVKVSPVTSNILRMILLGPMAWVRAKNAMRSTFSVIETLVFCETWD